MIEAIRMVCYVLLAAMIPFYCNIFYVIARKNAEERRRRDRRRKRRKRQNRGAVFSEETRLP